MFLSPVKLLGLNSSQPQNVVRISDHSILNRKPLCNKKAANGVLVGVNDLKERVNYPDFLFLDVENELYCRFRRGS